MQFKALKVYNVNKPAIKTEAPHSVALLSRIVGNHIERRAVLPNGKVMNVKAGTYTFLMDGVKYEFEV